MATIVDPREELDDLERQLVKARENHSLAAIAAIGREELNGNADRLSREVSRLSAQVDAIKAFAASPAAEQMDKAKRDAEARRDQNGENFDACLTRADVLAVVIESGLPFNEMGPAIAEMHGQLAEACSLWLGHVDEKTDVRTANRRDNIRSMLGTSGAGKNPVVAYLEVAAYRQNLTQTAPAAISMFPPGKTLFDVVNARTKQAREQASKEFPKLIAT